MDFVKGRIFIDGNMPELSVAERQLALRELARVLAQLHDVDWRAIGLADFGRADQYYRRSVARWSEQYRRSRTDNIVSMEALAQALPTRVPPETSDDYTVVKSYKYCL